MPTFDYSNLPKLGRGEDSALSVGESSFSRMDITSSAATATSGNMRLSFFTALKNETITSVRAVTGTTAAAATPTLCRFGVYQVDEATGDLTLIASTPNDTTLFSSTTTAYTKDLSEPFVKYKGIRYAVAVLVVSAVATPTFQGNNSVPSVESFVSPIMCATRSGQADLPATVAAADLNSVSSNLYFALV